MGKHPWVMFMFVIFALAVSGAQAAAPSDEQVDKIVAVLKPEGCELILANVKGSEFVVDAACADQKSYTFTLDKDFKILDKKPNKN